MLVETPAADSSILAAIATAAHASGVSVVSLSFGFKEFSGEQALLDSSFRQPGVVFVAATSDAGADTAGYPAMAPSVVAVGGTTLSLSAAGAYLGESGWGHLTPDGATFVGSGGGPSRYVSEPAYQRPVQSTGKRTVPDVAFDADQTTGVPVYDSYDFTGADPFAMGAGTSLGAPCWAGLFALVDQARRAATQLPLNAIDPNEAVRALYSLPPRDFTDIIGGSNGLNHHYDAGTGYDYVTGLGSPRAAALLEDLKRYGNALDLTPDALPPGKAGIPYDETVAAVGGTGTKKLTYAITAGTVPPGLRLAVAPGELDVLGTPTAAGTFTVTVTAVDEAGDTWTADYPVTIRPATTFSQPSLPAGQIGVAYRQSIAADTGDVTVAFAITAGALPAGLSVTVVGHEVDVQGTPVAAGAATLTVTFTDSAGFAVTRDYVLTIGTIAATLPAVADGATAPPGTSVTQLLGTFYHDADADRAGLAVSNSSGDGTWQYATANGPWHAIGTVSLTNSLLLAPSDRLRFLPAPGAGPEATLTFYAWDGTQGHADGRADLRVRGGSTPFSTAAGVATMAIAPVNHAPTFIGGGVLLTPILPDSRDPPGDTILDIFGGRFRDVDGDSVGIAVTSAGTDHGTWQLLRAGDTNWSDFPPLSPHAPLLLAAADRVRFKLPTGSTFAGSVGLQARAWDGTVTGTSVLAATLFVNTAPVLNPAAGSIPLGSSNENVTGSAVAVAALLQQAGWSDADAKALQGVAITGVSGPGLWQYRLGNGRWQTVPALSTLLLPAGGQVRFAPAAYQAGTAALTFRAWDQTQPAPGNTGGAAAISTATATVTWMVQAVNHAPTWTASTVALTGAGNPSGELVRRAQTGNPPTVSIADAVGAAYRDVDGNAPGIAVIGQSGSGTWQYSSDGTHWTSLGAVAPGAALLLPGSDLLRFQPATGFVGSATLSLRAWDGTSTATNLNGKSATGGSTAYSAAVLTLTGRVNTVNDAPTWLTTTTDLTPILPNTVNAAGDTVSSAFGPLFDDTDSDPAGIAITGVSAVTGKAAGTWDYLPAGASIWQPLGDVSLKHARLLAAGDAIRFNPGRDFAGTVKLTAYAWDGTSNTTDLSGKAATGGTSGFSAKPITAEIAVHAAPAVTAISGQSFTVPEDGPALSVAVAALLHNAIGLNRNRTYGVAIIGVAGPGTWSYAGTTLANLSDGNALLLSAGATLSFKPAALSSGQASLTYRVWDQSVGTAGQLVGVVNAGGASAFSARSGTIHVSIAHVNHVPAWSAAGVTLPQVSEGVTIADAFGSAFRDVDAGTVVGVAVTVASGPWQVQRAGSDNWVAISTVSARQPLKLSASDRIRVAPDGGFHGVATLSVLAWDGTAVGTGTLTAVCLVNTAPALGP
jgi:hypothetical protein